MLIGAYNAPYGYFSANLILISVRIIYTVDRPEQDIFTAGRSAFLGLSQAHASVDQTNKSPGCPRLELRFHFYEKNGIYRAEEKTLRWLLSLRLACRQSKKS